MTVTAITIDGSAVDLCDVEYQVVVSHGRNDISSSPQPSNCEFTTIGTVIYGEVGDVLAVEAYGVDRFTGKITDITITHLPNTSIARITYLAIGNMSDLGLSPVGSAGYPEESVEDRTTAIFTETGLVYQVKSDPYMILLAQAAANPVSALNALTELCLSTGATLYDTPDGTVVFESYTRRGYTYNPANWAALTGPWTDYPYSWNDVWMAAAAAPTPVALPCTGVVWEPLWKNNNQSLVNDVIITYGDLSPQDTVAYSDAPSIARYGPHSVVLTTRLSDPLDAYNRASQIVTAQSVNRYDLSNISVRVDLLSAPLKTQVLALISGDRVRLTDLPQPTPYVDYMGIVEGWTEVYTPGIHELTLSLSDPRMSYAMATWGSIPATSSYQWSDVIPSIQWFDVILPEDLIA